MPTKREEDYSRWYIDVIREAELADYAPVKGCMVIMPNGYAIWENIRNILDKMFKETGHKNAYFPLFIPKSFLDREREHVEGFSPECAWVTIGGGKDLEEPLAIRPTSETIIWSMYKRWISSWRDLPLLINQWANVVRWEMRTRLFLRTTEFLWQEGHTAHETFEEAEKETKKMLSIYKTLCEEYLAIPTIAGKKSEKEKFAGALITYTLEAMMQDKKALQMATSHNLGQNFAKAFDVTFQNREGKVEYVWATSWGVSTRLIGAVVMVHSDDRGLVLPPKIAHTEIVIIPIYKTQEEKEKVFEVCFRVRDELIREFSVEFDQREEKTPGYKFNDWERKGVPLRIEVGPRDLKENVFTFARRDNYKKYKVREERLREEVSKCLDDIQRSLYTRAKEFLDKNTFYVSSYKEFRDMIDEGGFFYLPFCGDRACEDRVKDDTTATLRCLPFDSSCEEGEKCAICGKESKGRALFAKSY